MKLYISNTKETPRMFDSDFMEFFSHVHWTVPLILFLPICTYLEYAAIQRAAFTPGAIGLLFVAGMACWTLTEYLLHRFVFHFHPTTERGRRIQWMFHGVHHDYPSDPLRLVMVPSVSLPLATLFYLLFHFTLGGTTTLAFMPGFLVGYLFYDTTHYAVHHFPIKGRVFGKLREHHMRHHFKEPAKGFGVSSEFWDIVFHTMFTR